LHRRRHERPVFLDFTSHRGWNSFSCAADGAVETRVRPQTARTSYSARVVPSSGEEDFDGNPGLPHVRITGVGHFAHLGVVAGGRFLIFQAVWGGGGLALDVHYEKRRLISWHTLSLTPVPKTNTASRPARSIAFIPPRTNPRLRQPRNSMSTRTNVSIAVPACRCARQIRSFCWKNFRLNRPALPPRTRPISPDPRGDGGSVERKRRGVEFHPRATPELERRVAFVFRRARRRAQRSLSLTFL